MDRLTHSLQTATRAKRDGRDDEYVVCALIHDIGDTLASANHADLAATILEPFVSEQNHWIVKHHAIFQGYYFFHHLGMDRNLRDQFRDHPWWKDCAAFCEKYDQNSFDAGLRHAAPRGLRAGRPQDLRAAEEVTLRGAEGAGLELAAGRAG